MTDQPTDLTPTDAPAAADPGLTPTAGPFDQDATTGLSPEAGEMDRVEDGVEDGPPPEAVTEDSIAGVLDALARTLNTYAAPDDDPTAWLLDDLDTALIVAPLTRILNRHPAAAAAVHSGAGDWIMFAAGTGRYVARNRPHTDDTDDTDDTDEPPNILPMV